MPNHLIQETSPYLLQHANNPVDWFPWGDEALQKARSENKPVFLSIGYAACHWCHVMEHESFENPATAEILNRYFISIKVDREERPDLDMLYMLAVQNMTGQGGWPLNVFLTPEGQPFYGGTYFPPVQRYGMPAFPDILNSLVKMWREDHSKILDAAAQLIVQVANEAYWVGKSKSASIEADRMQTAANKLVADYDWTNGGWGQAPKFPAPMAIEFLLTQTARDQPDALKTADHALETMQRGGLYDVVGGGFHRYSTDENWLVPHFEKMLYDNAQLALAYLHTFQITRKASFRQTAEETLDFILRELTDPRGGFYSSLDADSEGEEGKFYLWTIDELRQSLASGPDFEFLNSIYDMDSKGNFEGKIILQRKTDKESLSLKLGMSNSQFDLKLKTVHDKLLKYREIRVRPATDSKVLVSWNALAMQSFIGGGNLLHRPDFLTAAQRNADFLLNNLFDGSNLFRSWRNGTVKHKATLEDYASLITALLVLYQSDFNVRWYSAAQELTSKMIELFRDSAGGFYLTRHDQTNLVIRPKDLQDNATPCGNSLAAYALLLISSLSGNGGWYSLAEESLIQVQDTLARYPHSFCYWLQALDFAIGPISQVAVIYPEQATLDNELISQFQQQFHPHTILAASFYPPVKGAPEILKDRPLLANLMTVYICHRFVCKQPLNDSNPIKAALNSLS